MTEKEETTSEARDELTESLSDLSTSVSTMVKPELQEADLKIIKESKIRQEMLDKEDSLRRARLDASLADGISWGMGDDAIEEAEDEIDEVTWQTYKGQLTEKQEKTREKLIKRTEKIAHMKREIDLIRVKDIAQGGLTQGQQTQIARNEERIAQMKEELENLEETLNESIRESLGALAGKISRGKKKGAAEDDEDFFSDDDEFYDRTKKKPSIQKACENQSVETADTLLDKRDAIMKEMEDKIELFEKEKNKMASEAAIETESGDALDAYMSGLSSQLVLDKTTQLEKELSTLQSELDRILYLLKFADPTGEVSKRRDSKVPEEKVQKSEKPTVDVKKKASMEQKKKEEIASEARDELAESLNDLFTSVSTMVKSELQGTNNTLELLEQMNLRIAEEYKGYGDVASGLRVFVEQLKAKSGSFDEYVQQIDKIEQQVTQFEAMISVLDKYVSLLESKMQTLYQQQQHPPS